MLTLFFVAMTLVANGTITELLGEFMPGAYSRPAVSGHDVYRISVIGCDRGSTAIVAIETRSSSNVSSGRYVIRADIDIEKFCELRR
jgi:hypothetical protein